LLILGCISFSLTYAADTVFDFESGSLEGWTVLNQGGGVSVSQEDKYAGSYSVKMVSDASGEDYWSVQLETPSIATKTSHLYKISFWAKAIGGRRRYSSLHRICLSALRMREEMLTDNIFRN